MSHPSLQTEPSDEARLRFFKLLAETELNFHRVAFESAVAILTID